MAKYIQIITVIVALIFYSCASKAPDRIGNEFSNNELGEISRSQETQSDNRMVTYSASVDLTVKKPEETKFHLTEQIRTSNGYITREANNYITARIPSENMDDFLAYAKTLGKVDNESKTGTDITDQYRDNVLRLESLKTVQKRYLLLLERANTVSDIVAVEKELERINFEIERLEGRIKHAEQSVAYSSITVRFRERTKPGPLGWIFYGLYQGIKWLFVW